MCGCPGSCDIGTFFDNTVSALRQGGFFTVQPRIFAWIHGRHDVVLIVASFTTPKSSRDNHALFVLSYIFSKPPDDIPHNGIQWDSNPRIGINTEAFIFTRSTCRDTFRKSLMHRRIIICRKVVPVTAFYLILV